MNYKQHIIAGLVFSIVTMFICARYFGVNINIIDGLVLFMICVSYSILPDIDTPASKARQGVTVGLLLLALYYLFEKKLVLTGISISVLLFIWTMDVFLDIKHRGIFHTVFAGLLLSLPLMFLGITSFIVAFVSYLSHLLMDGVKKRKEVQYATIRT